MADEIKTWLSDIKKAIIEINDFLPDKKNFFQFQKDIKPKGQLKGMLRSSVTANRILKLQPDIKITDIKKIIDTRNRIIHGYDSVSDDIIWATVVKHLPKLEEEITALLK